MLKRIGALAGGDMATIDTIAGTMPSVLGPVPIPQPRTIDSRELEGTADRVKAVVRVHRADVPNWRCGCVRQAPATWLHANLGNCDSRWIRRNASDGRPLNVKHWND